LEFGGEERRGHGGGLTYFGSVFLEGGGIEIAMTNFLLVESSITR